MKDADASDDDDEPRPIYIPPPMTAAERACEIGDILELIKTTETSSWEHDDVVVLPAKGQLYRVVDLKGRGWDLDLVSGDGPERLRVMNSEISTYLRKRPDLQHVSIDTSQRARPRRGRDAH